MGELSSAVEEQIRGHFLTKEEAVGDYTSFEFRLDPPERVMFKKKILRRLIRRSLFRAEHWSSSSLESVVRLFISENKKTGAERLELAVDAASIDGVLKIVALHDVCFACGGTGLHDGRPCENDFGGVVCASGLKFKHGLRFEVSDKLESKRLRGPTPDEVAQAAKSAAPAEVLPLLESQDLTNAAIISAAKYGNMLLLEAVVPKADEKGLHLALKASARLGQAAAVQALLDAGASPNGQEGRGVILEGVCQHTTPDGAKGGAEVVKLLLAAGADPNLSRSGNGNTCLLHLAFAGWSAEAARLLLEAGADLQAMDNRSKTALDLAWEEFQGRDKTAVRELFDKAFAESPENN